MPTSVGIDVSKLWLDVYVRREKGFKGLEFRVANTASGFEELLKRCRSFVGNAELRFCMESTGGYELEVATYLTRQTQSVSVVNPAFVKYFVRSKGYQNKTDRADARAIAQFDEENEPSTWRLMDPVRLEIVQVRRHRERLNDELIRLRNYLEHQASHGEFEVAQLHERQGLCVKQVQAAEDRLLALVESHPDLKAQFRALLSIPGVGVAFALAILCELGDHRGYSSAEQFAAMAGVSPCRCESGSKKGRTKISKAGSKWIRAAGYMPAGAAMRSNPPVKALCERLEAKGLLPLQIRVAAMRKLIMQAFGVLKALAAGTLAEFKLKKAKLRFRKTAARVQAEREAKGIVATPKVGWRTKAAAKRNALPKAVGG